MHINIKSTIGGVGAGFLALAVSAVVWMTMLPSDPMEIATLAERGFLPLWPVWGAGSVIEEVIKAVMIIFAIVACRNWRSMEGALKTTFVAALVFSLCETLLFFHTFPPEVWTPFTLFLRMGAVPAVHIYSSLLVVAGIVGRWKRACGTSYRIGGVHPAFRRLGLICAGFSVHVGYNAVIMYWTYFNVSAGGV